MMNQFDHGYHEAITRVLHHIEFRRAAYKVLHQIDECKALDMLHKEIELIFAHTKDKK